MKDSRPTEDGAVIRRRRECTKCGERFSTFERVQLRELIVLKRSGRRSPFEREKLARSIKIALRKRPVDEEQFEQLVSGIVRKLESLGDSDIPSNTIGELVMEALAAIDPVAYVRYASVYKDFREPKDFARFLDNIGDAPAPKKR